MRFSLRCPLAGEAGGPRPDLHPYWLGPIPRSGLSPALRFGVLAEEMVRGYSAYLSGTDRASLVRKLMKERKLMQFAISDEC